MSKIVLNALDRLKPEKRAAVVLHEMEGVPVEDIAKIMGKPCGTVKSRLFHAKKELKRSLKKHF